MVLDILALQNEERRADHGRQEKPMRSNRHRPAQPGNRRKRPPVLGPLLSSCMSGVSKFISLFITRLTVVSICLRFMSASFLSSFICDNYIFFLIRAKCPVLWNGFICLHLCLFLALCLFEFYFSSPCQGTFLWLFRK